MAKRNAISIEPVRNLIAESSLTEVEANAKALDHLQKDFDIQPGDVDMLVLDQVIQDEYQLPQTVMVASTQTGGAKKIPKIGRCDISRTFEEMQLKGRGSEQIVSPGDDAADYFVKLEKSNDAKGNFAGHIIDGQEFPAYKVLEGPANGVWSEYKYVPNPGFTGKDRITFHMTGDKGREVIVTHFINVVNKDVTATNNFWITGYKKYCPNGMELRKISQSDFDPSTQDYATWLRSSELSSLLAAASQSLTGFQNLAGSSVGQTTGEGSNAAITLDFTAAGHGWYIDPTPLDNTDDFLPTSNPTLWQAKAGSAADGKMDMLSVLLHEYGHALGLEHSADSADYMAATLQSGQRRLPSADELTLMSQLVAQLKASTTVADGSAPQAPDAPSAPLNPSAPLGALLIGRLALGRRPEDEGQGLVGSQALFSANATLQGGNLSTLQDWATQGNVVTDPANTGSASTPAGATLAESTTS